MIYILIVMWLGTSTGGAGKSALAIEFNSLKACQAAAVEIKQQTGTYGYYNKVGVVLCAEKGSK